MRLEGLLSFPLTPFDADDRVDLDVLTEHLNRQLEAGPAALFVACGTGEFTALTPAEFTDVVHTAVKVNAGRVPVYAGAGGGPGVAREYVETAHECGADGVLLLPPYLVTSPPEGLLRHIRYVADDAPLPVVVYQRANAILDPATAVELLDVPAVTGIKDGIGDVDAMLRIVTAVRTSGHNRAESFTFLNGLPTAELSVQAYAAIGVSSYSSAVLTFVPEIATAFYRAVSEGDTGLASRLLAAFYVPFAQLRDEVPGYAVSLVKAGSRLTGLNVGGVRPPLVDPSPEHVERLAEIIAAGRAVLELEEAKP
jgi:5-dehydro-4-deoxyglucarate dehydratase